MQQTISKIFSLVPKDVLNSFILGFISTVGLALLPVLESGHFPTLESLPGLLLSGLTITIANMIRKYLTDENNNFAGIGTKSEPKP